MQLTGPKSTLKRARTLRAAMSMPERILWQAIRKKQIGLRFRRQHPAGPYVLDFYCDAAKLCVEVDGDHHNHRIARDAARDSWLAEQGVSTLRVAARDVLHDLDAVVRHIVYVAQAPSVTLRAPPPPKGEGQ